MYLEHFGLKAPPFQFTASPVALFMSRTHREALSALEWGLLHEPSGLTLLIGESGTGKTTLVCALLGRQYREVRAAYIGNPKLSFVELLGSILSQLGIRGGRGGKSAMLNAFTRFAMELPLNERISILIDEAQTLSEDALEEFRLMSNLERHGRKAAQIILAGQFELARRLNEPGMRQLTDRIGARAVLLSLSALECREYIEHRLRLCGSTTDRIFARGAVECIARNSEGVPRRINALCHNALLLAYARGARRVTAAMAREAAAEYAGLLDGPLAQNKRQNRLLEFLLHSVRWVRPVLGLTVLAIAGFMAGQLLMEHDPMGHLRALKSSAAAEIAPVARMEIDSKLPAALRPTADAVSPKSRNTDPPADNEDASSYGRSGPGVGSTIVNTDVSAASDLVSAALKEGGAIPAAASAVPAVRRPFVVVAPGDTLGGIAIRHLGSFDGVHSLLQLNPHITNPARVYPGEIVYLPSSSVASGNANDTDVEQVP
jgi:general secretion pathway protein A